MIYSEKDVQRSHDFSLNTKQKYDTNFNYFETEFMLTPRLERVKETREEVDYSLPEV